MKDPAPRLVPKVHPSTRPVEPEDPLTLHAALVPGDPEVMLQCLVQEYAWMGWGAGQILGLFHDPFYPALHALLLWFGEDALHDRVSALVRQSGVFCVEGVVAEVPEPAEAEEGELIQLGLRIDHPETLEGRHHV
jgi:hypothetical protein